MPRVIFSVPHAHSRGPEDAQLHQYDLAAEEAASGLADRLGSAGHEVSFRVGNLNRMEVDLNRPDSRGTSFRKSLAREFPGTDFLLDCHSFPPTDFHWSIDVALLRLSFGPDNAGTVHALAQALMAEGLSVAVVWGKHANDVVAHAVESGVPAVLAEFSEHEMSESGGRLLDSFAAGLDRFLGELAEGSGPASRFRGSVGMTEGFGDRIHVPTSDPTIRRIISASFPEYKGRHAVIEPAELVDVRSYWDEGNRSYFKFVRLSDFRASPAIPAMHPAFDPQYKGADKAPVVPGVVCVEHKFHGSGQGLTIHVNPSDMNQMALPAPDELDWAQKVVLLATRSYKSSYAGRGDFRYQEARRETGITQQEWDAASETLKASGHLDKRGAITMKGRNASERLPQLYSLGKARSSRLPAPDTGPEGGGGVERGLAALAEAMA